MVQTYVILNSRFTPLLTYFCCNLLSFIPVIIWENLLPIVKKIYLLLSICFVYILPQAQPLQTDSWKIKWNKKVILETGKENEAANTRKITGTDLEKNYFLEITYTEAGAKKEKTWNRSFIFFDENDKELLKKDSTRNATIAAAELKNLFVDKKKIKLYTIAVPADPDMAARVRVRRVHLCTLELQ
jgi:hypothetical protein